jgi:serine/threonine protein kinase
MAPELYGYIEKGSPYAVDIWAVGEIVFQMLTKQPTFKHPGMLYVYVNKPEILPCDLLLDAQVSQPGVEFILSAMRPIPDDRITAEKALHHRWMDHPLSHDRASAIPVYKKAYNASAIDSMTEEYASWNTTMRSPEAQSTTRSFLDGKLVTRSILNHPYEVPTVTFSPDGKLLASGSGDEIRL